MLKNLGSFVLSIIAAMIVAYFKFNYIDKEYFVSKKQEKYVVDTYRVSNRIISRIIKKTEEINSSVESTYYVNPKELSNKLNELSSEVEKYFDVFSEVESFVTDSVIKVDSEKLKDYLFTVQSSNKNYLYFEKLLEENSKALCFQQKNKINFDKRKLILKALIRQENKIRYLYRNIILNLKIAKNNLALSNSEFLGIKRENIKREVLNVSFFFNGGKYPFTTAENQTEGSLPKMFLAESVNKEENERIKNRVFIKSLPKCY